MLRPFIPSKNHERSRQFYEALGFVAAPSTGEIAVMSKGGDSFLLQNFYVKELAENLMLQLWVPDIQAWWNEYSPEKLADRFDTKPPSPPSLQPWGLMVGFLHDPSGVLWHVTEVES